MLRKAEKMVIALLFALLASLPAAAEVQLTAVERPVPEFELLSTDGSTWSEQRLAGKLTVINFWASWCPPCIEELPAMNRLWEAVKSERVGMLAINAGEGAESVERFLEGVAIDFPVILGTSRSLTNWGGRALPTTLVVNAEGQIIFEAAGPRAWDDAEFIESLLAMRQ